MNEQLLVIIFTGIVFLAAPLVWMAIHTKKTHKSSLTLMLSGWALALFFLYSFFVGQYYFIGSYYIRFAMLGLGLAVVAITSSKGKGLPFFSLKGPEPIRLIIAAGLLLGFSYINANIFMGQFAEKDTVAMSFPFKATGIYLVQEGSSSRFSNRHYNRPPAAQRYAVDLTLLRQGKKQSKLISTDIDDFHIYGVEVFSPCSGNVLDAVDGSPDNIPGIYNSEAGVGNYIRLQCGSSQVYLAHLQPGSIQVKPAQSISTGTPLARVGNSGFSTEPHLHIQVSIPSVSSGQNREPAPMTFDGRYLTNHNLFNVK